VRSSGLVLEPAEVSGIPAFYNEAVLEGESGHSSEVDHAIRWGHAEPAAAMGSAGVPAHDDVIAVGNGRAGRH